MSDISSLTLRGAPHPPVPESLYDQATTRKQGIIDIAVLISGSGSNLQALIDTPDLGARIAIVISDRPRVRGLERAEEAGLETLVLPWDRFQSREEFSAAIADAVEDAGAKMMVLAGFMRVLSREAIARFPDRILNIHPSLLPAFPGAHAVAQALERGVKVTGVTVHLVDEQVDHGPIVAQRAVLIREGDDVTTLHARIQSEEHDLYPRVVRAMAAGEITVEAGRVTWA
jgi:phosphoribosylglycinamide formyltransferase-1